MHNNKHQVVHVKSDTKSESKAEPKPDIIKMTDLYEILGIKRDANAEQIKRAYWQRCKLFHPDTGGTKEEFLIIDTAYNILSDPERRAKYDETGIVDSNDDKSIFEEAKKELVGIYMQIINCDFDHLRQLNYTDLKGMMIKNIKAGMQNMSGQKKSIEKEGLELKRIQKKFEGKMSELFQALTESKIREKKKIADRIEFQLKLGDVMIEMLADIDYKFEKFDVNTEGMQFVFTSINDMMGGGGDATGTGRTRE